MSNPHLQEYVELWVEGFETLLNQLHIHVQLETYLDVPDGITFWTDHYLELMDTQVKFIHNHYIPKRKEKEEIEVNESRSGTM